MFKVNNKNDVSGVVLVLGQLPPWKIAPNHRTNPKPNPNPNQETIVRIPVVLMFFMLT